VLTESLDGEVGTIVELGIYLHKRSADILPEDW